MVPATLAGQNLPVIVEVAAVESVEGKEQLRVIVSMLIGLGKWLEKSKPVP